MIFNANDNEFIKAFRLIYARPPRRDVRGPPKFIAAALLVFGKYAQKEKGPRSLGSSFLDRLLIDA
ncbi:MAG: hypothetical protein A2W52_04925 [Candidatus Taylorbacteria bacterium RIFCSPHIGHO2_02_49_25]|uniref:Uncharacterized protein n=1 Tax=Candidatus Taylorbacteria bacterium RIFCSPHIGHO2_02_49_25 TaxID=1802305 RepID=A0A1G2MAJ4_9BACT|nr:MAG: hypothetical protein A2759_01760 [Candidatus Taylorbacteria bacterium RIFCSPHIGHO2_01_FULL_49_60]OHA20888.1 MAG: hypothetical protein A2W52_04925 [Candidatus Taylorbacteria bacterium RIFCSPHIGHO2_02_49_25]OHA37372.1 MAG: hypothetical protein A2W65_04055 [Candidatus Taylorbacteria bacterium RIFCSPLOWO2_02_50_13]OHA41143.1 MAG: hypothetical protein A3H73_00595 [Candidatus Taylorbacteria bacterium RIFCSPLOWO2_02_FULL_50_120]OHA48028.1 MAG: hypothetical protein A3G61_02345 [Candidatus Taylo